MTEREVDSTRELLIIPLLYLALSVELYEEAQMLYKARGLAL